MRKRQIEWVSARDWQARLAKLEKLPAKDRREFEEKQRLELDGQHLLIPPGVEGQLVVGEHVGAALGLIEMRQLQGGYTVQPEQLGGLDAAMACDDLAVVADQDRIGEAEAGDAVGDLADLLG